MVRWVWSIPVAAQSSAWVCGRSLVRLWVRIQPVTWMSVSCECCLLFVVRSLLRANHSSRGVVPSMVCLSVIINPRQWGGLGPLGNLRHGYKNDCEWRNKIFETYFEIIVIYMEWLKQKIKNKKRHKLFSGNSGITSYNRRTVMVLFKRLPMQYSWGRNYLSLHIFHYYHLFSLALQPSTGYGLLVYEVSWSHTTTRHSFRTPLDEWSARRRDLYLTTHTTNIHAPGGIRTQDRSRRAAVDLRLRPRGHWNQHMVFIVG
jgi:hypothetical protein